MAGYANKIIVTLHANNFLSVEDNGRGIPVDINKTTKLSAVETVFTVLHAGGKFDDDAYKTAGGLHGVGSSVVNALSDLLICQVYRDKKIHEAKFMTGGKIVQSLKIVGETQKQGTKVLFHPDPLIFKDLKFNVATIKERLLESSFLFEGLDIEFIDEINKTKQKFISNNGISDFVQYLTKNKVATSPVIYFNDKTQNIPVNVAFQYTDEINDMIISFANSVKTIEGGSHVNGFKSGLVSAINNYAQK